MSGILTARSGSWLTVTTTNDVAFTGVPGQRVNQVSDKPYGDKSLTNYLNFAAFALPAPGTLGNYQRNSLTGPGFWQVDMALARLLRLHEAQTLELRVEAFNLFNNFNWGVPVVNFNSGTFGRITTQEGDPRIMQFADKVRVLKQPRRTRRHEFLFVTVVIVVVQYVRKVRRSSWQEEFDEDDHCRQSLAGSGLVLSAPAFAHHAVGGEYDASKPVTVTGTVTKVEWVNPHSRIYFDVVDPAGKVTNWSVELAARVVLERMGWNGRSLKIGEKVTVRGDQARSGAPMLNARAREQRELQASKGAAARYPITRADGTPVLNDR